LVSIDRYFKKIIKKSYDSSKNSYSFNCIDFYKN